MIRYQRLTTLSVVGYGRLQHGATHWATNDPLGITAIDPTLCGSRFYTGMLLTIEDFTFFFNLPEWGRGHRELTVPSTYFDFAKAFEKVDHGILLNKQNK